MENKRSLSSVFTFDRSFSRAGFFWAIGFLAIQIALSGIMVWQLPPEIPLFYSLPVGRAQLMPRIYFALLPLLGIGVLLVNLLIAKMGLRYYSIFSSITAWLTALIVFLGLVAQIHTLSMVY